ncbi:trehalose operon repressor [Sporolactobacillus sp. Y61]|uniref:Trehalose operon repressor n=1 Tax=Sporolactobacillus sp. Y61 TaxID=3160863 RepID=A0AAU8IC20_9BACL
MGRKKFTNIYESLTGQIRHKKIAAGDLLPSENQLCQIYHASRETVRKALSLLQANGYIQKIQGKGSVVLDVSRFNFPVSGLTSFYELSHHSKEQWQTEVHRLVLNRPSPSLMQLMNLEPDQYVWELVRTRAAEGERVILDKDFLIRDVVPVLTEDKCEQSLYHYIENELGLAIGFAKKEITVEPATEEDHKYLDLGDRNKVVVVRSLVFLDDTRLFQYTESRHRDDKFRFVDFARREHR